MDKLCWQRLVEAKVISFLRCADAVVVEVVGVKRGRASAGKRVMLLLRVAALHDEVLATVSRVQVHLVYLLALNRCCQERELLMVRVVARRLTEAAVPTLGLLGLMVDQVVEDADCCGVGSGRLLLLLAVRYALLGGDGLCS